MSTENGVRSCLLRGVLPNSVGGDAKWVDLKPSAVPRMS